MGLLGGSRGHRGLQRLVPKGQGPNFRFGTGRRAAGPAPSTISMARSSNPSLLWPRSRRSVCFPAETYPPLRSLKVYSQMAEEFNRGTKKSLTFAALSDKKLCFVFVITRLERHGTRQAMIAEGFAT